MRKASLFLTGVVGCLLLALATPAFASDKEKTITGEAKCAKCALKESSECQTVIQAEGKNGKTVSYYLADNDVSKEFHKNVCKEAKKVTAIGTVKTVDGKKEFTATKITLAQ